MELLIITEMSETAKSLMERYKEDSRSYPHIFSQGEEYKCIDISIFSFGFKYGEPIECDLVFDVRFIPNPYYIKELKNFSGQNDAVRDFVIGNELTQTFLEKISDLLDFLIPNYIKEGKSQIVIGIGCTGGRHRSVAITETIYQDLVEKQNTVIIDHRDIEKDTMCPNITHQ